MKFHHSQAHNHKHQVQHILHEHKFVSKMEHNGFHLSFGQNLCNKLTLDAIWESSENKSFSSLKTKYKNL